MAAVVKRVLRRGWCEHVLDDSDVPGYLIRCIACGQLWRRGRRGGGYSPAGERVPDDVGGESELMQRDVPRESDTGSDSKPMPD